jgi:hypothetical protein
MTYAQATGVERHIAAPRTALNTENGTPAAPNIKWVGWPSEPLRRPPTSLIGSRAAGRREGCGPMLSRGDSLIFRRHGPRGRFIITHEWLRGLFFLSRERCGARGTK